MSSFDPDRRQEIINATQPQDDRPAAVTHFQAMKCAAVVDAFALGHHSYVDAVRDVATFLQAAATEGAHGEGVIRPTAAEAWHRLDDVPWPAPGRPRPQPDTNGC